MVAEPAAAAGSGARYHRLPLSFCAHAAALRCVGIRPRSAVHRAGDPPIKTCRLAVADRHAGTGWAHCRLRAASRLIAARVATLRAAGLREPGGIDGVRGPRGRLPDDGDPESL